MWWWLRLCNGNETITYSIQYLILFFVNLILLFWSFGKRYAMEFHFFSFLFALVQHFLDTKLFTFSFDTLNISYYCARSVSAVTAMSVSFSFRTIFFKSSTVQLHFNKLLFNKTKLYCDNGVFNFNQFTLFFICNTIQ